MEKNAPAIKTRSPESTRTLLVVWLVLAAVQGFLAVGLIFNSPSESGGILFGLSTARLAMVSGVLFLALLSLIAAYWLWRNRQPENLQLVKKVQSLGTSNSWKWLLTLSVLGLLTGIFLISLTPEIAEPFTNALLARFLPLIFWLSGLCLQTLILFGFYFYGRPGLEKLVGNRVLRGALLVWGLFLLIWVWVAWSRVGLVVDPRGWNVQGAPLTEIHALLAWLMGVLFLAVGMWFGQKERTIRQGRLDFALAALIWFAAVIFWLAIPLPGSWFVTEPVSPNYAYYPNSDALIYDTTGQSMLVGELYKSWDQPLPRRPMYAMFLAGLRTVSNQNYQLTAALQMAILAFFPVMIYLLGRSMDNRLAGVIGAGLVILREGSGIGVSGNITVAHSRLLMSDLPNAFGVLLFTLIVVSWLQEPVYRRYYTLLGGAVVGTFMLIRPETGILLVAAGGIALLVLLRRPRIMFQSMILMAAGVILILAPWVWRNYQLTGQIFLEQPGNRIDFLLNRFLTPLNPTPTPEAQPQSSQLSEEGLNIVYIDKGKKSALKQAGGNEAQQDGDVDEDGEILPENGGEYYLNNILTHFMHSQIQMVLLLPDTVRMPDSVISLVGHRNLERFYSECCTTINYLRRLPFWFDIPDQGYSLPHQSIALVLVNLFLIALGISWAWSRWRWIGVFPLVLAFIYIAVVSLARTSGGRYILGVDWISIFYYSLGISQLTLWGVVGLTKYRIPDGWLAAPKMQKSEPKQGASRVWVLPFVVLMAAALLLPLLEQLMPPRYDEIRKQAMLETVSEQQSEINTIDLTTFSSSVGLILPGRALYPRFYAAEKGAPGRTVTDVWAGMAKPSFYPMDFDRMGFYLVGPQNLTVLMQTSEPSENIPHAADVLVFGCPTDAYLDARAVAVFDETGDLKAYYTSDSTDLLDCNSP